MTVNIEDNNLDREEQWYEEHSEEFIPAEKGLRDSLVKAAKVTASKTERMNIRMSKADMESLRLAASREGIPYQSLVTSILHKYTNGLLVDINDARRLLNR